MPPLHKHNRMQFLPSIPQTVTPKLRILPLPTAHRTLFLGSGESPADFQPVCFLWLLLLQNNYLQKNPILVSVSSKIPGFQSELLTVYISRRGGKKKLRSSSSPASMVCILFWVSFTTLALSHRFFKAINSTTPGYSNDH